MLSWIIPAIISLVVRFFACCQPTGTKPGFCICLSRVFSVWSEFTVAGKWGPMHTRKHSSVGMPKTNKLLSTCWSPGCGIQQKKKKLQCLKAKGRQSYQQSVTCSLIAPDESKHTFSICRASPPGLKWANGLRLFKQRAGPGRRLAGSRRGAICRGNQMWGARLSDQLIEFVLSGGSQIDHQGSRRRDKHFFFSWSCVHTHLMARKKGCRGCLLYSKLGV